MGKAAVSECARDFRAHLDTAPERDGWPGESIQDGGIHSNPGGVEQAVVRRIADHNRDTAH